MKALKRFTANATQDLLNQLYQINSVKKTGNFSESVQNKSDPDFESALKTVSDIIIDLPAPPKLSTENLPNPKLPDVPDFESDPKLVVVSKPDVVISDSEFVQQKSVPDLKISQKSVPELESVPKLTFQPDPENVIIQTIIKVYTYKTIF